MVLGVHGVQGAGYWKFRVVRVLSAWCSGCSGYWVRVLKVFRVLGAGCLGCSGYWVFMVLGVHVVQGV